MQGIDQPLPLLPIQGFPQLLPIRVPMDPFKWQSMEDAEGVRARAQKLGHKVRQACLTTREKCEGSVLEINERLELRMRETAFWKEELLKALKEVKQQIDILNTRRETLCIAITVCEGNLLVIEICIDERKKFKLANLTGDTVQASLIQESMAVRKALEIFGKTAPEVETQLRLLRKAVYNIERDLERKDLSLNLDSKSLALTRIGTVSEDTKLDQIDPQRVNLPEIWQKHSDLTVIAADLEVQNTTKLVNLLDALFEHVAEDLSTHLKEVNRYFEGHIQELRDTKKSLETQLSKVHSQLKETLEDEQKVLLECKDQQALMSLTKKRLQLHVQRPDLELCDDRVQKTIEVALLTAKQALDTLRSKGTEIDGAAQALRGCQARLEGQISLKGHILQLDQVRCYVKHREISLFGF